MAHVNICFYHKGRIHYTNIKGAAKICGRSYSRFKELFRTRRREVKETPQQTIDWIMSDRPRKHIEKRAKPKEAAERYIPPRIDSLSGYLMQHFYLRPMGA